ncbi:hypothetical protein ANCDUO_14742 [Ancylostoma duodenale]|uniref:Uncharacterized protein n=1 Tax=Ancylostoma duodenale TaxID=51022 RepID=A0A0C2CZ39_9BILA|nr:hypothetical protein ANCDUO_14742 [Ancylostoma duodenale]
MDLLAFLGEVLFSEDRKSELAFCLHIYYNLKSYDDLFTFEACIRHMLGMHSKMGKIRIFKKLCHFNLSDYSNVTWSYDPNLIESSKKIEAKLQGLYDIIERDRIKSLARMVNFL